MLLFATGRGQSGWCGTCCTCWLPIPAVTGRGDVRELAHGTAWWYLLKRGDTRPMEIDEACGIENVIISLLTWDVIAVAGSWRASGDRSARLTPAGVERLSV